MSTQDRVKDAGNPSQAMARLLALAAERGYLIHSDVVDELPAEHASPEELESVLAALAHLDIDVLEERPQTVALPAAAETCVDPAAIDEACKFLEDVVAHGAGASPDTLAVYARRMCTVALLTKDEEVALAKEIEAGRRAAFWAFAGCPRAIGAWIDGGDVRRIIHETQMHDEISRSLASMWRSLRRGGIGVIVLFLQIDTVINQPRVPCWRGVAAHSLTLLRPSEHLSYSFDPNDTPKSVDVGICVSLRWQGRVACPLDRI